MHLDAFDKYCTERTGRADIFASTATQATLGIDHRNFGCTGLIFALYHFYCAIGTVALTVATRHTVAIRYAVVGNPHCGTNLNRALHLLFNGFYCSIGTHLRTDITRGTTETALERHFGLHKTLQTLRGAQYIIGALRDTELTRSTVLCK